MFAERSTGNIIWIFIFVITICVVFVNGIKWSAFATKTVYEWTYVTPREVTQDDLYTIDRPGKTCKAIHVNGVYRHGARNPTKKGIDEINDIIKNLKENKEVGRIAFIDSWQNPYKLEFESDLVDLGYIELNGLGHRIKTYLKSLLENNAANLEFTSSSKSRAKNSGVAFAKGLGLDRNMTTDDSRIRFYDGCKNYKKHIADNATNFIEFAKFNNCDKFVNVSNTLMTIMGLNASLTAVDIYTIYELCAYGKFIFGRTDWCQLLSDSQREVLECGQDIKYWYKYSYGHPLDTKVACPLVSDMFLTMDAAMNDDWKYTSTGVIDYSGNIINTSGYFAGKFQFGHAGSILRLYTSLGLFKDTLSLLAINIDKMSNRMFKTSNIIPFAGNLVFIVYACDNTVNFDSTNATLRDREYYIKLLVNEAPVTIPGCGSDTCLYSTVRNMHKDHIDNCNIRALCDDDDGPTDTGAVNRVGLMMPTLVLTHFVLF